MRRFINKWGSTLIFASFVITAVTGVMLYFHVRVSPIEALHVWIGFLMIAGALFHVVRNWGQFLGYFRRPAFYGGLLVTALISAWLALPALTSTQTAEGGRPSLRSAIAISRAVSSATLADLAPLARTDANGLMEKLSGMGIAVSDPTASLQSVADLAGKNPQELAASLLGGGSREGGDGHVERD